MYVRWANHFINNFCIAYYLNIGYPVPNIVEIVSKYVDTIQQNKRGIFFLLTL